MARPRKDEARDTRQQTLDVALDLFAQSGFSGTSMRQIARAVGVRESALYHHFPSKLAILDALMKQLGPGRAGILAELDVASMVEKMGGEKFLQMLMHNIVESWSTPKEQKVMRLILREGGSMGRDGAFSPSKWMDKAHENIAELFAELMRLKVLRTEDPRATAVAFMGPMMLMRLRHLVFQDGPPDYRALKQLAERQFRYFWNSMKLNDRSPQSRRGSKP